MHSNKEIKNRVRKPGFCVRKFVEFCKRTDLHGYKYIVMEELSFGERCCWAVAVFLSIVLAVYFVVTAYRWYARNPIVTVIESTHGAIWDVPFPAVTICDLNYVSSKRARIFANTVKLPNNMTEDYVYASLRYAPMLLTPLFVTEEQKEKLNDLQDVLDLNEISIKKFFNSVGPSSCNNLVKRCMWKNTLYRCELLFQRITAHQTLCCTFNYYGVDTQATSSVNKLFRPKTPRRVASCGYQTALSVLVNIEPDDYYSTPVSSYGVLVYIDNAYNYPDINSPVRLVNPHTEVFIALTPERTYATNGVSRFSIDVRQCLYSDEAKVGKFNLYSFHNCMAYQGALKILKFCGCLPYFFPIEYTNRTCDFRDIDCMRGMRQTFEYDTPPDSSLTCLPDCEHYDYPLEVAMGLLTKKTPINNLAFFKDFEIKNHSLLNVFFNDLVSARYRRDVYLNWQNLLASFGGLMSLMLGFTLIAGFDFVLFFTFRMAYDVFKTVINKPSEDFNKSYVVDNEIVLGKKSGTYKGKDNRGNNWKENSILERRKQALEWTLPPRYEDTGRY